MVNQREALEFADDVAQLHLLAFEKLSASRHVEENVFNHEVAAFGAEVSLLRFAARSADAKASAYFGATAASAQFHLSDSGNRGKSFAAKSHGVEGEEVVSRLDFRRRMALESESSVRVGHSGAVVDNLYKSAAAVFQDYLY